MPLEFPVAKGRVLRGFVPEMVPETEGTTKFRAKISPFILPLEILVRF